MSKPMSQSVVIFKRLVSTSSEPSVRRLSPLQSLARLTRPVSAFERVILVWSGRFKNMQAVPSNVSRDTMERSRNYFNIRLNILVLVVGVFSSMLMVISGKNAVHRGETLQKQNLEWHKRYNEAHSSPH